MCRFENVTHANCTVPLLDKPGRNSVSFSFNSFVFESFIIAVGAYDNTVLYSSFEVQNTGSPLSEFTLQWNDQSDVGMDIFFNGFQRNYYIGDDGAIVYQDTITLNYGAFPNTGRVTLRSLNSPSPTGISFRTICRALWFVVIVGEFDGLQDASIKWKGEPSTWSTNTVLIGSLNNPGGVK